MRKTCIILVLTAALAVLLTGAAHAQIPESFSYQGMLLKEGAPFEGDARFKFALVDSIENRYFWSNDNTDGPPGASIVVPVSGGIFSVLVGGPPMAPIEPEALQRFTHAPALRVWVDIGSGEMLLGDAPLSSVLFAHRAYWAQDSATARGATSTFTAGGQIWAQATGFKFPDGTIQATAATGGGGASTLDQAYDGGGSGAGRTIVADAGPVAIGGNNWDVTNTFGDLMVGDTLYNLRMGVATGGVGAGTARVRAAGGVNQLRLGAGEFDVVKIDTLGFHVSKGPFKVYDDGQVNLVGDFGSGQGGVALRTENTNANGIALWAKTQGSDATMVLGQDGSGDMLRGFNSGALKFRVMNQGQVVTPSITITGGADLCEPFTMSEALGLIEPGSILVIDPENPGSLMMSDRAYDARVAGIVSGAGGVNPGLTLSQQGVLDGGRQVALSGRVYVRVSDENGEVRPGDMITTSTTPGVGMCASDRDRSYGAVVGKAMTGLTAGEGLVLVLVGLQ